MAHSRGVVSGLAVAVSLIAVPAFGQVNQQVAGGAALTAEYCRSHKTMQAAHGSADLAKVHDRLMMALRGERPFHVATWMDVGREAAEPSPELVQASLTNLSQLCDLHRWLHEAFVAGATPEGIRSLQQRIETAPQRCVHGT